MSEPPALPPSDPGFLRRHALMLLSAAALTVLSAFTVFSTPTIQAVLKEEVD